MKHRIEFNIDTDNLERQDDEHLAELWYIAQANPAGIKDRKAGELAELIGREIISRWVKAQPVPLWNHQGRHADKCELMEMKENLQ